MKPTSPSLIPFTVHTCAGLCVRRGISRIPIGAASDGTACGLPTTRLALHSQTARSAGSDSSVAVADNSASRGQLDAAGHDEHVASEILAPAAVGEAVGIDTHVRLHARHIV